jgi:NAD(P)-dependent dehydrogenase (short-subunit alcohol dehydrogenase family)
MAGMLDGRVTIVTGAGRGIGAGVARLLASEGAKVVVNDLGGAVDGTGSDLGPAGEVVEEIKKNGGEAVVNGADVSDFDQAEALVRQAIDTYGRLDVLVNVAGILRDRMIFNMSFEEWDAVVRVHLGGTFNTSRHAAAYWRELRNPEGHFRIINFTSGSGMHGAPGQPNYAAAKNGIVGLTYSCANALQRYGVTTNSISPAANTRMAATVPTERERPRTREESEMHPDNVAPAVAYLASERSDWCNGQVVLSLGHQIGIYNVPQVIREIVSPGPWDLEVAAHMMETLFKPAVRDSVVPEPIGLDLAAMHSTGGE